MQEYQERVIVEKHELDVKLEKLKAFCFSPPENAAFRRLPPEERHLLEDQCTAMQRYSKILEARIARFVEG